MTSPWNALHRIFLLLLLCLLGIVGRSDPTPDDVMIGGEPLPAPSADTVKASSKAGVVEGRAEMPTGQFVLGPGRKLPVTLEGLDQVTLRLFRVPASFVHHVYGLLGVHAPKSQPLDSLPLGVVRDEQRVIVQPDGPTFGASTTYVDVFSHIQGDLCLAVLEAPHLVRVALVERGRIATVVKKGAGEGLVWAVDTKTEKPVAGATVTVRQGKTVRFRGTTDARGIAALPTNDSLRLEYDGHHEDWYQPLVTVVEHGHRASVTSERYTTGIEPWEFGIPAAYWYGAARHMGTVTAERGIYRPGEKVHVFGVLRERGRTGTLSTPRGAAAVLVKAPDGSAAFQAEVALTEFGTFRAEAPLGRHAALGTYRISAAFDESTIYGTFQVGEYRTARFEVELEADETALMPRLAAKYLYGAPVTGATVIWSQSVRAGRAPKADGFSYAPLDGAHRSLRELASGEGKTDAQGQLELGGAEGALPDEAVLPAQLVDVVVEASVTDAAGDTISTRRAVTRARGPAVVGVRSNDWMVDPSRGWSVDVKTVDAKGTGVSGQTVTVEVIRRYYATVAKAQGGRTTYVGGWQEDIVRRERFETGRSPKHFSFALPGGGRYRVRARIDGHAAYAEDGVWAFGRGSYADGAENDPRIEIRTDRESYEPGDRAKLVVGSPYPDALALVTVERDGVLHAETRHVAAGAAIPLEIRERYLPGAFASVALVPTGLATRAPAAGIPFRMGTTAIDVSAASRRLTVKLSPDENEHRPGDQAHADVVVTDSDGRPVRAEVTLWAADEGVLMLTGYQTPNFFEAIYEKRPLGLSTATNFVRWFQPGTDYDDGTGGDYGESGTALRSRFLSTAFFAKPVVTDVRGRATVAFELPDNLTRWRIMASVTDEKTRFGRAEASIVTKKPVQAMPSLPRFLTEGDRAEVAVLVSNQTDHPGKATVELDVEGATLASKHRRVVDIGALSQVRVPFTIEADRVGTVQVSARARVGRERDGFRVEIPAHPPTAWQSRAVASGTFEGKKSVDLKLPPGAIADSAEVVIDVSYGPFAKMGGAIDSLLEYPHGCVEQTTSRLIPLVQLERILRGTGDPRLSSKAHHARMDAAIAHVLRHQNRDGGFGLWPTSDSESFLTAYALWGLETALEAGYDVPDRVRQRGFRYLREHLGPDHDMHGQFSEEETLPFAAYVMAISGQKGAPQPPAGDATLFSKGLLGVAYGKGAGEPSGVTSLLGDLSQASRPHAQGGKLVRESVHPSTFAMGRDVRATAAAVEAMLAAGRTRDADELVRGIVASRLPDGTWGTTYNNLWALNAIAAKASRDLSRARPTRVAVDAAGARLGALDLSADQPLRQTVVSGKQLFGTGRTGTLTLSGAARKLDYVVRLRWLTDVRRHAAESRGYRVRRKIIDASTGKEVGAPKVGQLLRVELEVDAAQAGRQVAVQDFLPAGFEAVDTALETSQGRVSDARGAWYWSHRELHDERVTFFANHLRRGTHRASYLARATRAGTFVRPPARAEAMYDPDVYGIGDVERITVSR